MSRAERESHIRTRVQRTELDETFVAERRAHAAEEVMRLDLPEKTKLAYLRHIYGPTYAPLAEQGQE